MIHNHTALYDNSVNKINVTFWINVSYNNIAYYNNLESLKMQGNYKYVQLSQIISFL